MKKEIKLSVVIIAKNEEEKIGDCLKSVSFADEIVLVDTGSTDRTIEIALKHGVEVNKYETGSYDSWRNYGAEKAKGRWILYVDADERVTPLLRREIKDIVKERKLESRDYSFYAIPRRNIILGKEMKHGGWWPDYVKRLFLKSHLIKWTGKLYEEPEVKGDMGHFKNPFIHVKYDNLEDMVEKTNKWSEIEAKLLFKSDHPQMSWWRFFRIMFTELWYRLILKKGILDGAKGIIYAFYQMWSRFVTYAKLWEMQINSTKLK